MPGIRDVVRMCVVPQDVSVDKVGTKYGDPQSEHQPSLVLFGIVAF